MSISSNDSGVYSPIYEGGPGWVWGGGDAGWIYQGSGEQSSDQSGSQASSALAQTIIAGLRGQVSHHNIDPTSQPA